MQFDQLPRLEATCDQCKNRFLLKMSTWRLLLSFVPLAIGLAAVMRLPESRLVVGDVDVVHGALACVLVFLWTNPAWRFGMRATSI